MDFSRTAVRASRNVMKKSREQNEKWKKQVRKQTGISFRTNQEFFKS